MAENKSDRPYLSLSETLCLIAFGIPEETGGSQWRRQQPGFMNRAPKKPVANHLAEAHGKVIHEEIRRFLSASRSLEQEMRRGTINPLGLHPDEAIQTVIPLVDRASLVIDPFGGDDESGELHPDRISFNDQHTWQHLLFPSDEAFALWPPAGQETKPRIDRRPTDQLPTKAEPVEPPEREQPERGPSAARPNRRGRKKGSGGYDSKDAPLLEKIHTLVENKDPMGLWNAALTVADQARGKGNAESKAKRLVIKYKAKHDLR